MSSNSKYNFNGKVSIVTGSSSGIGRAIALQLVKNGSKVTITGRDVDKLAKVGQEIANIGGSSLEVIGDLTSDKTLPTKLVTDTIAKFGKLDYVVNCAGIVPDDTYESADLLNKYDQVMNVIVRARLALIQSAVPHLQATKGAIVNISASASAFPWLLLYSTANAAGDMLTKVSASQLASKGIRVNSVNPGPVRTPAGGYDDPNIASKKEEFIKSIIPLNRLAEPEEIANLTLFLLSDDARNMTGSIVFTDGGYLVKK